MADASETKFCANCKRDIASANFVMHEVHCKRNIVLCKKCNEPYPRSELDEHIEEEHSEVACQKCFKKFERSQLEHHEENDCPKRMVKCAFCEIDIARDELDEHHEYCGTRTEQCHKCQKYIMIKDQQRHEDSSCTYPEQKPNPPQNGATNRPTGPGRLNSFVFNELSRMTDIPTRIQNDLEPLSIDDDEQVQPRRPIAKRRPTKPNADRNVTAANRNAGNVSKNTNAASSNRRRDVTKNVGTSSTVQPRNQAAVNRGSGVTTKKTNNTQSSGPSATNRPGPNGHSDAAASSFNLDSLMDMPGSFDMLRDEELAELLSQFPEEDDAALGTQYSPDMPESGASPDVSFMDKNRREKTRLPCEFCGFAFPSDDLVLHQSACPAVNAFEDFTIPTDNKTSNTRNNRPGASAFTNNLRGEEDTTFPCEFCGMSFPGVEELVLHETTCNPEVNSYQKYPNNEAAGSDEDEIDLSTPSNRRGPQVVDNLGYMAAQDMFSRPIPQEFTDNEDTMLPCEFCSELFPLDFLVQHQAICDANLTQTPRVRSPNVPRQKPGQSNPHSSPVLSRARRHQPDPDLFFADSDSDDSPSRRSNNSRTSNQSRGTSSTSTNSGFRKTNESTRDSKSRTQRTLDDLVNNPVPMGPTNYLSRVPNDSRRERSTAFRPSKDTSIGTNRRTDTSGPSSRGSRHSRNGQHADSETSGYQASFAQPKAEAPKRGTRPIPKSNVGSDLGSLNGLRIGEPKTRTASGPKNSTSSNKKTDASRR